MTKSEILQELEIIYLRLAKDDDNWILIRDARIDIANILSQNR